MPFTGRCLCGEIRFEVLSELTPIQVCYCEQCRRAQGGAFAAVIPVQVSAFRLLAGQDVMKSYASSPGKERLFCGRCGSPVMSRRSALPSVVRLRVGLFDEPIPVKPAFHAFTASKCSWWSIADDLPQHLQAYVPPDAADAGARPPGSSADG